MHSGAHMYQEVTDMQKKDEGITRSCKRKDCGLNRIGSPGSGRAQVTAQLHPWMESAPVPCRGKRTTSRGRPTQRR